MKPRDYQMQQDANTADQQGQNERILARKMARELTPKELAEIAGGMRAAGTSYSFVNLQHHICKGAIE